MTVVLHNFQLSKALKAEFEADRQLKIDDFTSKVRSWELRNASVMADYWSNPLCIKEVAPFPVL